MSKPRLLYISVNDGSDTRINKEINTLARDFDIDYIGIGRNTTQSFAKDKCWRFGLVRGHHKSIPVFLQYHAKTAAKCLFGRYNAVHVINENLLLLFMPFLWHRRRKVVLDVFDSIFLRSGGKHQWLQRLCYRFPKRLIVTDNNRKHLIPKPFQAKTTVVENYPYRFKEKIAKLQIPQAAGTPSTDGLLIFYNGSMSRSRGTDLLLRLLETDARIRVKMAGWVYDEPTRQLSEHPNVEFMGVITQQESLRVAAGCDYILSLYEPINANNINASPNKIYDAIQAGTPVIVNREVKIAAFVEENRLGYVMESFYETHYAELGQQLAALKSAFSFDESLRQRYTWEAVEQKLTETHLA
ncbi:MAG: hypothetical protein MUD08_04045 [Cytophagales bacterium]|nr:hypothetical protein [Cytophagales bacterium]